MEEYQRGEDVKMLHGIRHYQKRINHTTFEVYEHFSEDGKSHKSIVEESILKQAIAMYENR